MTRAKFDRHAILKAHYAQVIAREWNFAAARAKAAKNVSAGDSLGDPSIGHAYLGSVFAIMPSGKYYAPWTSNQTSADETRDAAFMEAFEAAAEHAGGWIESGEGDPCDMFFACTIEDEADNG